MGQPFCGALQGGREKAAWGPDVPGSSNIGDPEAGDRCLLLSHLFCHLSPPEDGGTRNAEGAQLHLNWKGVWVSSDPDRVACFNFLNKSWLLLQPVGEVLFSLLSLGPRGEWLSLGRSGLSLGKGAV